jgi:hypothetical protein
MDDLGDHECGGRCNPETSPIQNEVGLVQPAIDQDKDRGQCQTYPDVDDCEWNQIHV